MYRRIVIPLLSVFVLALPAFCQDTSLQSKANDAFNELSEGKLTLRFFNALTGEPIEGARVAIENAGNFTSDAEGRVLFKSPVDNGDVKVTFEAKGFVTSTFTVKIMAGTIFFNRFSVSPTLLTGQIRIVLDWAATPPDLDEHLIKQGSYHISYRNMITASDGSAELDRDDRDGYGPETITINTIDPNADYKFYVHDYTDRNATNSTGLSRSKATVKIFSSQGLVRIYHVPENTIGKYWHVFRIENGNIVDVDEMSN